MIDCFQTLTNIFFTSTILRILARSLFSRFCFSTIHLFPNCITHNAQYQKAVLGQLYVSMKECCWIRQFSGLYKVNGNVKRYLKNIIINHLLLIWLSWQFINIDIFNLLTNKNILKLSHKMSFYMHLRVFVVEFRMLQLKLWSYTLKISPFGQWCAKCGPWA